MKKFKYIRETEEGKYFRETYIIEIDENQLSTMIDITDDDDVADLINAAVEEGEYDENYISVEKISREEIKDAGYDVISTEWKEIT